MKKLLILDVCDTLYPTNTTMDFIAYVHHNKVKNKLWRLLHFLKKILIIKFFNVILFKLTKFDLIRTTAIFTLKGYKRCELIQYAQEYIQTLIPEKAVLKELEKRELDDFDVILASASLDLVIEQVNLYFQFNGFLSSRLEYNNKNECKGSLAFDALDNKKNFIINLISEYDHVCFITDNKGDNNCIELVNEFIAVIPKNKNKNKNIKFWKGLGVKELLVL